MQDGTHSLVAVRCQMKVIVHVLVGDGAVRVDEAGINVEEGGVWERRHCPLDQLVHLGISISHRVWHFAPRQYALETKIRVRPGSHCKLKLAPEPQPPTLDAELLRDDRQALRSQLHFCC